MKRAVLTFAVLVLFACSGCATTGARVRDPWFSRDKLWHLSASAALGAGTTLVAKNNGATECGAPTIGIAVTMTLGAGKETYDVYGRDSFFSWKDMVWNLLGSTLGSFAASDCH